MKRDILFDTKTKPVRNHPKVDANIFQYCVFFVIYFNKVYSHVFKIVFTMTTSLYLIFNFYNHQGQTSSKRAYNSIESTWLFSSDHQALFYIAMLTLQQSQLLPTVWTQCEFGILNQACYETKCSTEGNEICKRTVGVYLDIQIHIQSYHG